MTREPAASLDTLDTPARSSEAIAIPGFAAPGADAGREAWVTAFEDAYATSGGDPHLVPWCRGRPHPALVAWLDRHAHGLVRPGAAAVVVGCGMGDDAAELAARGYDVCAFDASRSAVDFARLRFGHMADSFSRADLFDVPRHLVRRSDLVVASELLTWLPPRLHGAAAGAIVQFARPRAVIALACSTEGRRESGGAPFPVERGALLELMAAQGFTAVCEEHQGGAACVGFRRA